MAAVCIWYKEEQKGNKTGMNQDRVYENRRNSYQGNPMERPEPFFAAQPLWGRSMEEQQEAREREARGDAELRGPLLLGIGGLHKLVARGWWRQSVTAWITAAA